MNVPLLASMVPFHLLQSTISVITHVFVIVFRPGCGQEIILQIPTPRCQASFLSLIKDDAMVKSQYRASLHKTREIRKKQDLGHGA